MSCEHCDSVDCMGENGPPCCCSSSIKALLSGPAEPICEVRISEHAQAGGFYFKCFFKHLPTVEQIKEAIRADELLAHWNHKLFYYDFYKSVDSYDWPTAWNGVSEISHAINDEICVRIKRYHLISN